MRNRQLASTLALILLLAIMATTPSINLSHAFTPSPNQTMEPSSQIPDITAPQVEISNFSGGPPGAFTFTNAGILFRLTISNVGNYAIQNLVLKVNLTLADGETPDEIEIPSISNPLQAGQSEQLSGAAVFGQYYMNIMGVQQYWSITVETSLSNLVLAQKTFEYPPPPAPTPETYSQHLLGQILVESPQNGATVGPNSTIHFSFQIPDAIVARVGTAKAGNYLLNGRAYNSTLLLDFCMFAGCTFDTPSQQIYDNVYFNNNHLDTWGASFLYQNNTVLSYQGGDVYNGIAQIPFSTGTHTFEIWLSAEQNQMSSFDDIWTGFSETITFTVDLLPTPSLTPTAKPTTIPTSQSVTPTPTQVQSPNPSSSPKPSASAAPSPSVPEFLTWTALPLVFAATLTTFALLRRKANPKHAFP